MRWVKHLTTSHQDEKHALLLGEYRAEAYGVYWLIVEIIAIHLDEGNRTWFASKLKQWCNWTYTHPIRLKKLLGFMLDLGLLRLGFSQSCSGVDAEFVQSSCEISKESWRSLIVIDIPNLLKYRDEWTKKKARNSGVTQEPLRRDYGARVDTEETYIYSDTDKDALEIPKISDEAERLAQLLLVQIISWKPDFKKPNGSALKTWADQIDKMIRLDNRKPEQISAVIRFATTDEFWQTNILSGKKLREKFDQLQGHMRRDQKTKSPGLSKRQRERKAIFNWTINHGKEATHD